MRTQEEINIEYSKNATLAGHCQFKIKLLEDDIKKLLLALAAHHDIMCDLNKEKPCDPVLPEVEAEGFKREDTLACGNIIDGDDVSPVVEVDAVDAVQKCAVQNPVEEPIEEQQPVENLEEKPAENPLESSNAAT